ncbi:MAG: N-acetylneuraminate synthase family protein [Schwartzia sp.]|nr:N-acetylneuraminate synthase family protein [Schwartzia sp. (in: firmicutes)]
MRAYAFAVTRKATIWNWCKNYNDLKDEEDIALKQPFIIAEIGINHNGDLKIAKELIDWASQSGADAVKFQKRTVEKVYTKEELDRYRESPWGTTNREQKMGLEFGKAEYDEIDAYCKEKNILWSASAWDMDSQMFLRQYDLKFNKVASAMLTNMELLQAIAEEKRYTYISTGMSSFEEIDAAVEMFRKADCPFELMHCNSTYPMKNEDANLAMIDVLRERYHCPVGYSGHETGRIVTFAAAALGATSIERHITLDRSMYGSDQPASLEVTDFYKLVKDIRALPAIMGTGEKTLSEAELAVRKKLRGC